MFKDEGGSEGKGNLIYLIRNDDAKAQYSWFVPKNGNGLTRPGMGRINRSLEAFVYCVLGAQVNIRSGIVGNSGGAVEAQQEMLKLFESAVIEEDLSTSVQRYQLAVQEAKLRLDLAIAPGIWLMPSNLVINTESICFYVITSIYVYVSVPFTRIIFKNITKPMIPTTNPSKVCIHYSKLVTQCLKC